jgi:hypothetical protein
MELYTGSSLGGGFGFNMDLWTYPSSGTYLKAFRGNFPDEGFRLENFLPSGKLPLIFSVRPFGRGKSKVHARTKTAIYY